MTLCAWQILTFVVYIYFFSTLWLFSNFYKFVAFHNLLSILHVLICFCMFFKLLDDMNSYSMYYFNPTGRTNHFVQGRGVKKDWRIWRRLRLLLVAHRAMAIVRWRVWALVSSPWPWLPSSSNRCTVSWSLWTRQTPSSSGVSRVTETRQVTGSNCNCMWGVHLYEISYGILCSYYVVPNSPSSTFTDQAREQQNLLHHTHYFNYSY